MVQWMRVQHQEQQQQQRKSNKVQAPLIDVQQPVLKQLIGPVISCCGSSAPS